LRPSSAAEACGSIRIEKPRPAAQSSAPSEVAATHTGGCGCCIGFGRTSTPSKRKCVPVKWSRSSCHARSTISTLSRKREIVLRAWQDERLHFTGTHFRFDGVEVL